MSRLQMAPNFEQIRRPAEHPEAPRPKTPPEPFWKRMSLNPGAIVVVGSLALGLGLVVSLHSPAPGDGAAPAVAVAAPAPVATPAPAPPAAVAKIETVEAPAPAVAVVTPAHVDPVVTGAIAPKKLKHKPKLKHPKPAADDE